jgi:endonuclease I
MVLSFMLKKIGLAVLWLPLIVNAGTFAQAKKQLYLLYEDYRVTVYCGCPFDKKKQVDLDACGNAQFRAMYSDLMNLVPAVGEINQNRWDYLFGIVEGLDGYSRCRMMIDSKAKTAYPLNEHEDLWRESTCIYKILMA